MTNNSSKELNELIILYTIAYELRFHLSSIEGLKGQYLDLEVEFWMKPELVPRFSIKSERVRVRLDDLRRLKDYFENHMQSLESNSFYESYIFTDYTLAYQIQASCGGVALDPNESYLSCMSMVNIGKVNNSVDSTYIGGESTATFNQIKEFINSLENLFAQLES